MRLPYAIKPERRRWKRHWFHGSIQVSSGSRQIDGLGIQLSRGGMYLFAIANLPLGSEIKIAFSEPGSGQWLEMRGAIRYRAVYLYGVKFLPEEYKAQLEAGMSARPNHTTAPSG
jgi:hypothetical protein